MIDRRASFCVIQSTTIELLVSYPTPPKGGAVKWMTWRDSAPGRTYPLDNRLLDITTNCAERGSYTQANRIWSTWQIWFQWRKLSPLLHQTKFLPDWRKVETTKPHMPQQESLTHVYVHFRANDLHRKVSYSIKKLWPSSHKIRLLIRLNSRPVTLRIHFQVKIQKQLPLTFLIYSKYNKYVATYEPYFLPN